MRVGFLPHERLDREVSSTFGFSFTPTENKLVVTSVFEGSQPFKQEFWLAMKYFQLME